MKILSYRRCLVSSEFLRGWICRGVGARENGTSSTYRERRKLEALWNKLGRRGERGKGLGNLQGVSWMKIFRWKKNFSDRCLIFSFIHSADVYLLSTSAEHCEHDDEQDRSLLTVSWRTQTNKQKVKRQISIVITGLPWWSSGKASTLQRRGRWSNPWSGN